jgi:hypothetical protein
MRRLMRWMTILMVGVLLAVGMRYSCALVWDQKDSEMKRAAERTGHLELDLRQRPTLEALGVAPGRIDVVFDPQNPPYLPEDIETNVHLPEGRELVFVADSILAGAEVGGHPHHLEPRRTYTDLESARDALFVLVDMIGGPAADPTFGAFDRHEVMRWYDRRRADRFGSPDGELFDSTYFTGPKLGYLTVEVGALTTNGFDGSHVTIEPNFYWDPPN